MTIRRVQVFCAVLTAVSATLSACSSSSSSTTLPTAPTITGRAPFTGHGSVDEAYELGAKPGTSLELVNRDDHVVGRGTTDDFGSLIIRNLTPGPGFTFRLVDGAKVLGTAPFAVLAPGATPPSSLYTSQTMHQGLNYIKMRDGVYLAATVRLPAGKTLADGPFPTVIEYSGYQIAAPHDLLQAALSGNPHPLSDPLLPDTATAVGSIVAPLLGFASVSLQMRGTGCSGGAFGLFDYPAIYDGYDAVEIVAHQNWVSHHKVGLVGISFSGISQLFVAGTRPPDLAAAAPMSVTNDLYDTGYPGGIFNNGFAASWIAQRFADSQPAPGGGQQYAQALVKAGDQHCIADQKLRLQTQSVASAMAGAIHRDPTLYDVRTPAEWAKKIDVPLFLTGAFQDEQTGGQWPALIPNLKDDPNVWVTVTNGTHADSLGPDIITRWLEFLDIFVAQKIPTTPPVVAAMGSSLYTSYIGAPAAPMPPLRFTNAPNVATARADFIKDDSRVRVLLDNGGNAAQPGALQPGWEADFSAWPPPKAVATREYLGAGGTLSTSSPKSGQATFRPDPSARPATDISSGSVWQALPKYNWQPVTGTSGLGFVSAPLTKDVVVVGPAALDVTIESSARDTDLQATISEVRPDGKELFMTSGVLRASNRHLNAAASTALHPVPTYTAADQKSLPSGRFTQVQIPLVPFAYAFRAGSRIRVTIEAPGGDRPAWSFDTAKTGGSVVDTVAFGGAQPSALVLAVVPGLTPTDPQPPCPSLRGEPCRMYVPAGNGG